VPTVTLQSEDVLDCLYTGPWSKKIDYDNNTTDTQQIKKDEGSNEAMFGPGTNSSMLFKVLAGVFGTLVVALLCINVYLMCDRASRDSGGNMKNNLYIPSQKNNDQENPANIHPTKALSYLPSGPPPEQLPMIQSHRHDTHQHLQIMPQHINAPITNSPYHGQMTETDEGLMELRPGQDMHPLYNGALSKTLPRRLHDHQHELTPPQKFHTMQRGMTGIPPGYNPQMYQPHQYMP